jgi:hypothetical protein
MPNTVAPYRCVSLSHEFDGYSRRGMIDQAFFEHYLPPKKKWARPGGVSFRGAGPASDQRYLGSGLSYGCVGACDCAPGATVRRDGFPRHTSRAPWPIYMAAPPLRGPGCQRWEGDVAAAQGGIASWRWGNAHDTVASLVLLIRPTRLMTGHSFAIARRVAPDWVPTSPLGA